MTNCVLGRGHWVALYWGIGVEGVLRKQFQGEEWDRTMGWNGGLEKLGVALTQAYECFYEGTFGQILEGGERERARMVEENCTF